MLINEILTWVHLASLSTVTNPGEDTKNQHFGASCVFGCILGPSQVPATGRADRCMPALPLLPPAAMERAPRRPRPPLPRRLLLAALLLAGAAEARRALAHPSKRERFFAIFRLVFAVFRWFGAL